MLGGQAQITVLDLPHCVTTWLIRYEQHIFSFYYFSLIFKLI